MGTKRRRMDTASTLKPCPIPWLGFEKKPENLQIPKSNNKRMNWNGANLHRKPRKKAPTRYVHMGVSSDRKISDWIARRTALFCMVALQIIRANGFPIQMNRKQILMRNPSCEHTLIEIKKRSYLFRCLCPCSNTVQYKGHLYQPPYWYPGFTFA